VPETTHATTTLSETDSKRLLAEFGVPIAAERLADDADEAAAAAAEIGFPVVAKLNGDAIAHKTERGLVRLGLGDVDAVRRAATELLALARPDDGPVQVHVLGTDLADGQRPPLTVAAGSWQAARSRGDHTLVGCTVAPGFEFSGFELAPPGWEPGAGS